MVFIDTSHLVALAIRSDGLHDRASAWSARLNGPFLTTEFVLLEFVNRLSAPNCRPIAHEFVKRIYRNKSIQVLQANSESLQAGLVLHADRPDKSWSLTDCISFLAMQKLGVQEALTYDQHFEQTGFVALLRRDPATS